MIALGASLATAAGGRAAACDQWTGATSTDWAVASNWSAGVPSARTPVCIAAGAGNNSVIVSGKASAATVTLGGKMQLEIGAQGRLRTAGSLRARGTLTFAASSAALQTPSTTIARGGQMVGVGDIQGSVINAGKVFAIDGGTGVPLRISAHYDQLASGLLLSRDEAGGFVELRAGTASLAGRLDLLILDALQPGSKYAIVSSRSLRGRFAHLPPGYVMRYTHGVAAAVVTPHIRLGRSRVGAGTRVAVFGASFGYLGLVRLRLDSRSGVLLGTANVNSVGGFEGIPRIPSDTPPGPHTLVAVKSQAGYTAKARFTVTRR